MKVGILGNIAKVKEQSAIDRMVELVRSCGYETKTFAFPKDVQGVDVVIVLGGDGAILHASLIAAKQGIKIIGVNYGNLGFLTEYEKDECGEIKQLLQQIEKNECKILKRSLLEINVGGQIYYALNELAVQRNNAVSAEKNVQILRLLVQTKSGVDYASGDGLLVCTPTGSTAYSLSAGGAILTPEAPVFMTTPICAFSMRTRPTVFSDKEELAIMVKKGYALIVADGLSIGTLPEGGTVFIKKAPFTADFPMRENSDFFAKVRNKLSE